MTIGDIEIRKKYNANRLVKSWRNKAHQERSRNFYLKNNVTNWIETIKYRLSDKDYEEILIILK